MSFYSVPNAYSALLGSEDIPSCMLPSSQSKMIPCTSVLKSVRTQSANLSAGAMALWQINTGSGTGYIKPSSLYLRGKLTLTMPVGTLGWRFSGPKQGIAVADARGEGGNKGIFSASALISRMTVSNGSQQLSQLTNYNAWHDLLLAHGASSDYVVNDATVYEFTGVTRLVTAAGALANEVTINFAIPIISPVFNSQQAIPLFLLNSPLSVEILFNSIADSFVSVAGTVTSYVIDNAEIVYEEIQVSPELKASIMSKLQGGAVWKQYLDSVYSIQTSPTSGLSYNVGVGLSSCKAVLGVDRQTVTAGTFGTGDFMLNGFSNVRVLYDGKLINNFDLNNDVSVYAELNRTIHSMFDSNVTSCLNKDPDTGMGSIPWTDFCISKFAWGISSQAVNDMTIGFSGQPVQMINIQHFNTTVANDANFPYVNDTHNTVNRNRIYFVLYDELLTIDANGICSLLR